MLEAQSQPPAGSTVMVSRELQDPHQSLADVTRTTTNYIPSGGVGQAAIFGHTRLPGPDPRVRGRVAGSAHLLHEILRPPRGASGRLRT